MTSNPTPSPHLPTEPRTLFDTLQTEFTPTLDSTLIAALLAEIERDADGNKLVPSQDQVDELRNTLGQLALVAEEEALLAGSYTRDTPGLGGDEDDDEADTNEYDYDEDDGAKTLSSWTTPSLASTSTTSSNSSSLTFLQTALPEVPTPRLKSALKGFDPDTDDIWDVIATILTEEYIRERQERGVDALDEDDRLALGYGDGMGGGFVDDGWAGFELGGETGWETVQTKQGKNSKKKAKSKSKSNSQTQTIRLADVRQQHRVQPQGPGSGAGRPGEEVGDPWTQITSLATHLATILPPHPATTFSSFFHSHKYPTPYDALRAALLSLCPPPPGSNSTADNPPNPTPAPEHTPILFTLLDILLAEYDNDDNEEGITPLQRARLVSDAELAVSVTAKQGDLSADAALDLVHLLRELDSPGMGVYHSAASPLMHSVSGSGLGEKMKMGSGPAKDFGGSLSKRTTQAPLPSHPPAIPAPPLRSSASTSATSTPSSSSLSLSSTSTKQKHQATHTQWRTIPERQLPTRGPHPLAMHIPTYARDVNGNNVSRRAGGSGKSRARNSSISASSALDNEGMNDFAARYNPNLSHSLRRRSEMLREASRMWQRGNRSNRGGEVAAYFAERAREFQEMARREQLDVTRRMVLGKRSASGVQDTLDLHGATVSEGITIVKEVLESYFPPSSSGFSSSSPNKPLKIITGRGQHSVGSVSVLKPAVRRALMDDGWVVTSWDAGLVVKGRGG